MLQKMEREVALQHDSLSRPAVALPPNSGRTFSALFEPQLFSRLVVGGTTLIAANTLIYEFVTWLPTFFVQQGLSIASSFKYFFLMTGARLSVPPSARSPPILGGVNPQSLAPPSWPFFLAEFIHSFVTLLCCPLSDFPGRLDLHFGRAAVRHLHS